MTALRIAGLVLAGGRSKRFGADKAVAMLRGRFLMAWSLAALAPVCEVVAVSGGAATRAKSPFPRLQSVADDPAHAQGPLAGVAAGLSWARLAECDLLVTLPCDTPLVKAADLEALIGAIGDAPAAYAATPDGPQSLCAVWRTSLASALAAHLAAGDHPPVHRLLGELGAVAVAFDDARPFLNINTPADLAMIQNNLPG